MLVLTRRIGEEIVIGGNIQIKVLLIQGERVRLGITAPESVRVDREEIHARRSDFHHPRGLHDDLDTKVAPQRKLLAATASAK